MRAVSAGTALIFFILREEMMRAPPSQDDLSGRYGQATSKPVYEADRRKIQICFIFPVRRVGAADIVLFGSVLLHLVGVGQINSQLAEV